MLPRCSASTGKTPGIACSLFVLNVLQVILCVSLVLHHGENANLYVSNYRDVDETISWIKEKEQLMASDDFGRDLASVQALLRKHEGLERDLAALEDKARTISPYLHSYDSYEHKKDFWLNFFSIYCYESDCFSVGVL